MSSHRTAQSPFSPSLHGLLTGLIYLLLAIPMQGESSDALAQYTDALTWPDKAETAQILFTEERSFPFRKYPKRYAGQMFRAPNGEVAIVYTEPRALRLIIKPTEIILDQSGDIRELPTDGADARAISDLMRGDIERLREDWISEPIDGGLRLNPQAEGATEAIKYIDITVTDGRVSAVAVHQRDQIVRRFEYGKLTWVDGVEASRPFAVE